MEVLNLIQNIGYMYDFTTIHENYPKYNQRYEVDYYVKEGLTGKELAHIQGTYRPKGREGQIFNVERYPRELWHRQATLKDVRYIADSAKLHIRFEIDIEVE